MRIFKWSPTFNPNHESSIVPIWISLPELPAHLFQKDALFAIAKHIGTPKIADSTYNKSNLSKARVCVEIDLLKPTLEEIDIQICGVTIVQKIEYEQVPHYCSLCNHIGHQESECYSKGNAPKPKQKMKGKTEVQHARKVLDNLPVRNYPLIWKKKGESSCVDALPAECEIIGKQFEDDAIMHVDADDNSVNFAENEITNAENNISIAENSTAENENFKGDVVCNVECVASGKGNENGLHVVDIDASISVGNDDVNAINCVANAKVIEETETIEREEAVKGKQGQPEKAVGIITTRPNHFIGDLWRGKKWISAENAVTLMQNLKRFGVVIESIKEDVEEVIKRNRLAVSLAIRYHKCVLLFDLVLFCLLEPSF
ncbi:UNVERIFIED_CONTAM: hypothetical protein Sangu_3159500 [Sesamum angustifolium]|uniref:DUF4283 domain-containing protein n=1 Tax=Sesamum angustifolium TaxID=2727405 RepID=A0AAW2JUF0_9LAMI